jgi:hypothetical protein
MRPVTLLVAAALSLHFCLPQGLSARILNIPDEYQTIQAGVNASENDDTVLVQPGEYVENLVISDRDLVLASLYLTTGDETCIDSTVIDGDQNGSVIYLENGVNRTGVVIGFTIRNGSAPRGGGVYLESYNVVIEHCKIRRNRCSSDYGGGICNYWDGNLKLSYCTFDSNKDAWWGGAVFSQLSMSADHCVFSNNSASGYGGAVHLRQWPGGTFTNCAFVNNSAPNGGAIQLWAAAAALDRCTIANNQSPDSLGGLQFSSGSKVILNNSILWDNEGYQVACDNHTYRDTVSVSYSDIQGGEEGIYQIDGQALIRWNDGNIDTDPLFVDPDNGDFTLQSDSPCRDAGDPDAEPDPDGSRADMGALPYAKYAVVRGYVYDSLINQPLAGVVVRIPQTPSIGAVTDSSGFYLISQTRCEFDFSLTAALSGYADSTDGSFRLSENDTLDWDFRLLRPVFTPSEGEVIREVAAGDSAVVQLMLGNSGNYPLQWRAERQFPDEPDAWSLMRSYHFLPRIEGVALVGEKFYVAGSGDDANYIYVFNLDGQLVDMFVQPGESHRGMKDLTWDGELLWGSGERNIYGFTTEGEPVATFRGPYLMNQALAWDIDRELLWICSVTSNEIAGYNRNGNQLAELTQPGFRIYGLAYWSGDPDGYPLYIFHSPDNERQVVHKMNPDTGDTMFVRNLEPAEGGSPRGCEITGDYELFTQVFLSVANNGDDDRVDVWFLDVDPTFVTFTPTEGVVDVGGAQEMAVVLSAAGLDTGRYYAELHFIFPEVRSEAVIPVTMRVEPNSISDFGLRIADFGLGETYPNPFNSQTAVSYQLSAVSRVSLKLYDVAGRLVSNQELGIRNPGSHRAIINGERLASGVYFLKLAAGNRIATRKIVCVK